MILLVIVLLFLFLFLTGGSPKCREYTSVEIENLINKYGFEKTVEKLKDEFITPEPRNFISEEKIIELFKFFQKTGKGTDILVDYWYPEKTPGKEIIPEIIRKHGKYFPELAYKFSGRDPTKYYNIFKKYRNANIKNSKPEITVAALAAGCDVNDESEMAEFYRKFFISNKGKKKILEFIWNN